jgi:hypothetical protein
MGAIGNITIWTELDDSMRGLRFIASAALSVTLAGCLPENTLPEPRPAEEEPEVDFHPPAAPVTNQKTLPEEERTPPDAVNESPSEAPPSDSPPAEGAPPRSAAEELAARPLRTGPKTPLTPEQCRARSSKNLYQISAALSLSLFFPTDIVDRSGKPLLSWRVRMLPVLGYEELFDQFHLNEPWDSPHNMQLLAHIPQAYQSPERFDGRTNYLAPVGPNTAFTVSRDSKLQYPPDGFAQTILVVEADEELAVPWTKPVDLPFDTKAPRNGLGNLREDGFFAVLGSAKAHVITKELDDPSVASLFAVVKEGAIAKKAQPTRTLLESGYSAPVEAEPLQPLALDARRVPLPGGTQTRTTAEDSTTSPTAQSQAAAAPPKAAVPDEAAQEAVRKDMRDLFQSRYKEAKTAQERLKIASELLRHSNNLGDDAAGRYVMLRAALDIAAANGDVKTARSAADQLRATFLIDAPPLQLEAIRAAAKSQWNDQKSRTDLARWAKEACDDAYTEDDYATARELYQIALSLARSADDRGLQREVMLRFNDIEDARREYAQVAKVVESLEESPDDPQYNLVVGRYFCFMKEDWDRGLPFLAKGGDRRLAALAVDDLALPADPVLQADLGDAWWAVVEEYSGRQKTSIQRRAAGWYRQAIANLPHGLAKVKSEIRLKELESSLDNKRSTAE